MKHLYQKIGIAVVLLGLFACQVNEEVNTEEVRQAIEAQNEILSGALESQDSTAVDKIYTEDAWLMPQNSPPVKGKEAIKEFFGQMLAMGYTRLELSTTELFVHGDAALETGSYRLFSGDEQVDNGSYIVYWKKVGDTWRLHRDIFNTDMPPPEQSQ